MVEVLLANGADIAHAAKKDALGNTAIHVAALKGHLATVNVLLKYNAEIINKSRRDGFTPLIVAIDKEHFDVVEALVAKGANINKIDKGTRRGGI